MSKSFISLNNISYILPNGVSLLNNLSWDVSAGQKWALIGENGVGKSTLLKLINTEILPSSGTILKMSNIHYMPQIPEYSGSLAVALGWAPQLEALQRIAQGQPQDGDFDLVADNWDLAEVLAQEMVDWGLGELSLETDFVTLSGGEKEKLMLMAAFLSPAEILFLDEPTNNLDDLAKEMFNQKFFSSSKGIVIVSHDRNLLGQMPCLAELTPQGLNIFGGNYEFYLQEKERLRNNIEARVSNLSNENSRLEKLQRELDEREGQKNRYGEKQVANHRYSRMAGSAMKRDAQNTKANKKLKLDADLSETQQEIYNLELSLKEDIIKIPLPEKPFLKDRLVEIKDLCFGYESGKQLFNNFNLVMRGNNRILLQGQNGAGKSTLIKLLLGQLEPQSGTAKLNGSAIYLDQNLSLLDRKQTLLDNVINLNSGISLNKAYSILANFKFRNELALKKVGDLSGGELLRASLAAILGTSQQPELIVLDEPTNNLDIKSTEILEVALQQYQGALLVVSHDAEFVNNLGGGNRRVDVIKVTSD